MYCIVLTKEGSSQLISLVPSTWVDKNSILRWPRTRKTSDLDQLRRDKDSVPAENWRKLKCKIKLNGIDNFAEGLKLEELYSKFEDTEDEERYHKNLETNRKHPTLKVIAEELLDLNSEMMKDHGTSTEIIEYTESRSTVTPDPETQNDKNKIIEKTISSSTINADPEPQNDEYKIIIENTESRSTVTPDPETQNDKNKIIEKTISSSTINADPEPQNDEYKIIIENTESRSFNKCKINENTESRSIINPEPELQNYENVVTLHLNDLNQIIANNSELISENKILKESIQRFQNLEQETQRGFAVIQVQLDKLFDLMKTKGDVNTSKSKDFDGEIAKRNLEFPINTKEQLDLLEDQLIDMEFEKALVKNFSKICGTSGTQKISKIGLHLVRCLFTDELLCQLSWKGIKSCTKIPFIMYIKTRNLFFKIIHQADNSCSAKESDSFLQNSAIKHSGQRIKRKSSDVKTTNPKKKKNESEKHVTANEDSDASNNLETTLANASKDGLDDRRNKIDETLDTRNCSIKPSKVVTVLADIKIKNKIEDVKHETKRMNISSDNLLNSEVFKQT